MSEKVQRARASLPGESSLATVLAEPFRRNWLASFVNHVREQTCVDEVDGLGGDVRRVFVN